MQAFPFFSFFLFVAVLGNAIVNGKTQCGSTHTGRDTTDGWRFFEKDDVLYLTERGYTYCPDAPETDGVRCTEILVADKNENSHQASINVTFYNFTADDREQYTETYQFSEGNGKNLYNKFKATNQYGSIGGAFKFMFGTGGCAVLEIDVDELPETGAEEKPAVKGGKPGQKNENKKPVCFIVQKPQVTVDEMECCKGAIRSECNDRRFYDDYQTSTCSAKATGAEAA